MNIRHALLTHLQATGHAVYPVGELPVRIPEDYITFQRISNVHERHLAGGAGLAHPRFQVNCWSRNADTVAVMADEVRKLLDNYTGTLGTGDTGTDVRVSMLEDDESEFIPPTDASQVGYHHARMDFTIWHVESVTPS